ncbi:MAG: phasin family protein [Alphaproteobacteria bacterium]
MTSDPNGNPEVTTPSAADLSTVEAKKRPATPVVPAERVKRKPVAQTKAKAEPSERAAKPLPTHEAATEAVRSVAEQSLDQVRSAFSRSQEASMSFARGFEASGHVVQSGLKEMQVRVADALEAEAQAAFGYFRAMTQIRTLSDMIDLQSSQMRKQFERSFDEARELSSLATAVATKASEPVRKAMTHALDAQRPSH